jgi:polyhydroxyalkanoate synthesis regulator phasin
MLDVLRRYVDTVTSVADVPRERVEKVVGELAKRGELRAGQVSEAVSTIVKRQARNRAELVRLIRKEIGRQLEGAPTREDLEKLTKRIRALETRSKPKAPAKRTTKQAKPTDG